MARTPGEKYLSADELAAGAGAAAIDLTGATTTEKELRIIQLRYVCC